MRCIDANALMKDVREHSESYWADDFAEYWVNKQPTIEPQRKKGWWILVKGSNGKDYHKCSECLHTQEITGVKNYCAVCGAEMREPEDIPMEYFESGGKVRTDDS